MVLQPRKDKSPRFGLFRFRSPLLTESILFIFLRILRCFTSPRVALPTLYIQVGVTEVELCWVAPFGYPRIKACVPLPEAFRSLLRPSSPDDAKASIICCNWFHANAHYSRRLSYLLLHARLSKNKSVIYQCVQALTPYRNMVGPDGLEPSTPRLSSACSNQLSYEPLVLAYTYLV